MTPDNNGWPGEPGVPLNPERDGWHWCERDGGLEPRFWSSGQQLWAGSRNSWISPKMLLALFGYAGPCLTPTEVESHKHAAVIAYANLLNLPAPPNLIAQARRGAREEAAKWHDEQAKRWQNTYAKETLSGLDMQAARVMCLERGGFHIESAAAIRALKGEGDD